jgi:hypothetical protein
MGLSGGLRTREAYPGCRVSRGLKRSACWRLSRIVTDRRAGVTVVIRGGDGTAAGMRRPVRVEGGIGREHCEAEKSQRDTSADAVAHSSGYPHASEH